MTNEHHSPTSPPAFPGFDIPRQNYFKMPNNWTDITAAMSSIAELKVVEYVLKHTWGYQEYGLGKRISLTEFMKGRRRSDGTRMDLGTGLSKPSVIAGLKAAIERGLLLEETDDSDRARIKKFYRLRMTEDDQGNAVPASEMDELDAPLEEGEYTKQAGVKHLNAEVKDLYRGVKTLYPGGKSSLPRTEKETTERNQQERKNNNNNSHTAQLAKNATAQPVVVASLIEHGVGRSVAQNLVHNFEAALIEEKIAYLEFLQETRPSDVKKPAAWLRSAIERDFGAPDGFMPAAERERLIEEENARKQALLASQSEFSERERERQEQQVARRKQVRKKLRKEYGIKPEDEALWQRLLDAVQTAGDHALYGLLANTQLLSVDRDALTVAVAAGIHARQLESERMKLHLKRALKRLTQTDYKLQFLPVEDLA